MSLSDEFIERALNDWRRHRISLHEAVRALSQREAVEPVACKTCNGIGVVDDGEIDCFDDGTPYECGPIKCVKDCPTCTAPSRDVPEEWVDVVRSLLDIFDVAAGWEGKFGKELDALIDAQQKKIDIATAAARALLASKGGAA